MAADDVGTLFRVRKTLTQMLLDRGYLISSDEQGMSLVQFKEQYGLNPTREQMTMLHRLRDDNSNKLFVFFMDEDNVGVKPIRKCLEKMKEQEVIKAIIVVKGKLTPFAKQALQNTNASQGKGYRVEQFLEKELLVNITEHVLVPTHQRLTKDEKKALLRKYKLKETQLPRIQHKDPVARYYGLDRGDVSIGCGRLRN
jgi:DNA-directed RNA polymerase I, II, and III subunit RPABC1